VIQDNQNAYLYDGEGQVCAVTSLPVGSRAVTGYLYDADGTRVAKGTLSSFNCGSTFMLTNWYVLGPSGEQLTETDGSGNWIHTNVYAGGSLVATYDAATNNTVFALTDWLGTKRVEYGVNGCATAYTSLPFGDGLTPVAVSGYTQCPDDATEHHFTGKERDAESGNDYFGARYYSSNMGRWMSPDYSMNSVILELPQSWNKYNYVLNRPTYGTDPDGRCPWCVGAIVGGVIEGGVDLYNQLSKPGASLSTINGKELGAHVLGGAVAGALAVATGGASLVESAVVGDIAAGGTANIVGGVVTRALDPTVRSDDVLSAGEISQDAVSGFVGGGVGHLAGDVVHLPDEPTRTGQRRLPARTPDGRFASYNGLVRQQVTRAGIAGGAVTHVTNWFGDFFFPPPVQASGSNTRVTVTIVSCKDQNGNPCQ
jgi:RHS repeat-associated protein